MGRHPIHDDADAGFVQGVYQKLEIFRIAETVGGRVKASYLVAPRGVKGVLGDWHELDMGEAHLFDVFDQLPGQFAIVEEFGGRFFPPRTQVKFIDADRRLQRIGFRSAVNPCLIGPLEFPVVPNDGIVARVAFEEEAERVGLLDDVPLAIANFVFVLVALLYARDKNFPDAGLAKRTHQVETAIPIVEVADDADALGVGGPDGEAGAGHAINSAQLGAQLIIDAELLALAEQIQIRFADGGQEGIGIARAMHLAGAIRDYQLISVNTVCGGGGAFENLRFGDAVERE